MENNRLAFSLGRLAACEPQPMDSLVHGMQDKPEPLDALIERSVMDLTAYQNAAYARQYAGVVATVRQREAALQADPALPFTRAVAQALFKLMAYKDEYEVARLYTDGEFSRSLRQQFEGDLRLEFYMAPPGLSRPRDGRPPVKLRLGGWMMPVLKLLAHGRRLRGTAFDFFGYTEERRMERALIDDYKKRIDSLLPSLDADRLKVATEIALLPLQMRGFGHVKQANVALARVREAELLYRFDSKAFPRPAPSRAAGQIRGIAVTAAGR